MKTKDAKEARQRAPAVLAQFDAIIEAARNGTRRVSLKNLTALAGEWYRAESATWGDDPDQFGDLDIYEDLLFDQIEPSENNHRTRSAVVKFKARDLAEASALLTAHDLSADPDTVKRLARILFGLKFTFADTMRRRLGGDWAADKTLDNFPALEPRKGAETGPKITFQGLIDAWAAESGTKGKSLYDRERTAVRLAEFVGHDDANRLTADDVIGWKEARLLAGRKTNSIANDIGELRPIWTWGKRNRKLTAADNPFTGLSPRTKKFRRVRGPYTEDEARKILTTARTETTPTLRWLPWVLAFTGGRLGEITQAIKEDIQHEGNVWALHIHGNGEGRTLKTFQSERFIPLHSALINEGF